MNVGLFIDKMSSLINSTAPIIKPSGAKMVYSGLVSVDLIPKRAYPNNDVLAIFLFALFASNTVHWGHFQRWLEDYFNKSNQLQAFKSYIKNPDRINKEKVIFFGFDSYCRLFVFKENGMDVYPSIVKIGDFSFLSKDLPSKKSRIVPASLILAICNYMKEYHQLMNA